MNHITLTTKRKKQRSANTSMGNLLNTLENVFMKDFGLEKNQIFLIRMVFARM